MRLRWRLFLAALSRNPSGECRDLARCGDLHPRRPLREIVRQRNEELYERMRDGTW